MKLSYEVGDTVERRNGTHTQGGFSIRQGQTGIVTYIDDDSATVQLDTGQLVRGNSLNNLVLSKKKQTEWD